MGTLTFDLFLLVRDTDSQIDQAVSVQASVCCLFVDAAGVALVAS